ncbi:aldose 1-epimerase family protein [Demequina aurantiaca]|uniref:aldose 1-epimerase family protein n=1 Tax=Demequina aurantiaca TaxID=676200 RepID=UPI003D33220E
MNNDVSPTGEQINLERRVGDSTVTATVTSVGAGLRVLKVDGLNIVQGFAEDAEVAYCAGQILIPWPNRVRDGAWTHEGVVRQLPVNEPELNNAIHGFLLKLPHEVLARSAESVILRATIPASDGYPWELSVVTEYVLTDAGISITHRITNASATPAPVAVGSHPFPCIGDVPTEDLVVTFGGATRIVVDDRLNPTGAEPVAGTRFDLSGGRRVGDVDLDTAYTDIPQRDDGTRAMTATAPDGRCVTVWGDSNFAHAQIFNTDQFPTEKGTVWALALEPTTAPPNALASGEELHMVAAGDTWELSWGVEFQQNI